MKKPPAMTQVDSMIIHYLSTAHGADQLPLFRLLVSRRGVQYNILSHSPGSDPEVQML